MSFFKYIAILFLILDSCIEPFNLSVNNQEAFVVDGLITDQPGPYLVKISKTSAIDDQLDIVHWVSGATVSILDDAGNEEKLIAVTPGIYRTDSLYLGVVGKTYQLRFMTDDGDLYESSPEKLLPVGEIDSVYYEFVQTESPLSGDASHTNNGFNVFLNGKVTPEQEGLVRWRWTGTFEIKTFPELKTKASNGAVIVMLPDPPPCSGFNVPRGGGLQYSGPCTCCYCWVTQYNDKVLISDDQFVDNNTIKRQNIAFIQANRRYLYDKYQLEIEQMSISQSSYTFWKKVTAQQSTGSNLFQTPPPPTTGNIQAISGKLPALGIFSASSIKKKSLTFTRLDVPYVLLTMDTIPNSCKTAYPYTSTSKPTFW